MLRDDVDCAFIVLKNVNMSLNISFRLPIVNHVEFRLGARCLHRHSVSRQKLVTLEI